MFLLLPSFLNDHHRVVGDDVVFVALMAVQNDGRGQEVLVVMIWSVLQDFLCPVVVVVVFVVTDFGNDSDGGGDFGDDGDDDPKWWQKVRSPARDGDGDGGSRSWWWSGRFYKTSYDAHYE